MAVKTIPWKLLLDQAPRIIDAANVLLKYRKKLTASNVNEKQSHRQNNLTQSIDPNLADLSTKLNNRIDKIEENDNVQAELSMRMADSIQGLTQGLQTIEARLRIVIWVSVFASIIALFALLVIIELKF